MTPSDGERARAELSASEKALREAQILLEAAMPDGAVSRLYYGVFHAARGALASRGLSAKTHSGQIRLFQSEFGPAPVLSRLLELRVRADYGEGELSLTELAGVTLAADAHAFAQQCRQLVATQLAKGPDEPDPPPDL